MVGRRRQYRAGESALQIWHERRRQTLRREWKVWTTLSLGTIGLGVGLFFATGIPQVLMAIAFGSLTTTLYVGWEIGGDIHSMTWRWGHWGEQDTEDALRPLEQDGWRVTHDIARDRGNFDHVVVGPGGLFLLDTKASSGRVSVRGDRLYFGRSSVTGSRFRAAALELHQALNGNEPPWVQAVVVIWGDFEQVVIEDERVAYVSGKSLAEWLSGQERRLSAHRVQALADAVEKLRPSTK